MKLQEISSLTEYEKVMVWVDEQFESRVQLNSPEGDNLQNALILIKQFEDINFAIPIP